MVPRFPIATFSIVAYNPDRQEWGVAVQSKFLACAAVVSWARAGAGAVATQSYANMDYGPDGLALLAGGQSAGEVVAALTEADEEREWRQLGVVDTQGGVAAFTGSECMAWAGHQTGEMYSCQGNILVPGTVAAMATAFEKARDAGQGELADWLVTALAAGQSAGGDSRGRQAAGVLVVREKGGYGGRTDRYLDLRVDDHPTPIKQLHTLVEAHHLFFGAVDESDLVPLESIVAEMEPVLWRKHYLTAPVHGELTPEFRQALVKMTGTENLEERWRGQDMIERKVVAYLKSRGA